MKLFKKQANFALPMVSCYKTTKQSSGTQNYSEKHKAFLY